MDLDEPQPMQSDNITGLLLRNLNEKIRGEKSRKPKAASPGNRFEIASR